MSSQSTMGDQTDNVKHPDFTGRVCLVTGASQGIGYEIAKGLAASGARVLVLSRRPQEAKDAITQLETDVQSATGRKPTIEWIECDLSDLKATRAVAEKLAKEERIDVAVMNAGVGVEPSELTKDGFDSHLTINVLSQMLIVNRLLPLLRKTAAQSLDTSVRIVFQSSSLHMAGKASPTLASIEDYKSTHDPTIAYGRSKLALIYATKALVRHAKIIADGSKGIRVIATHPGAVSTSQQEGFKRAYPWVGQIMAPVVSAIARNPDQGSLAAIYAAASPDVDAKGLQGVYLDDPGHEGIMIGEATEDQRAEDFWSSSQKVIKQVAGDDALLSWTE